MNTDSRKSADSSQTIQIVKAPRRSTTMCVHDMVGKSAVYYRIETVLSSLLGAFTKKIVGLPIS